VFESPLRILQYAHWVLFINTGSTIENNWCENS